MLSAPAQCCAVMTAFAGSEPRLARKVCSPRQRARGRPFHRQLVSSGCARGRLKGRVVRAGAELPRWTCGATFRRILEEREVMSSKNLAVRIVAGLSPDGIPFPAEEFDPVRLTDPEEFRELLGAQELARRVLPCAATTARYWRYYLFGAPSERGRLLAAGRRLLHILEQTEQPEQPGKTKPGGGIGRIIFGKFREDGRRSEGGLICLGSGDGGGT